MLKAIISQRNLLIHLGAQRYHRLVNSSVTCRRKLATLITRVSGCSNNTCFYPLTSTTSTINKNNTSHFKDNIM